MIKKPTILILDEVTSSLDHKDEEEIQKVVASIQEHDSSLTIIRVCHKIQVIESVENLLFIKSPKEIVAAEKGSPEYDAIITNMKTYVNQGQGVDEILLEESSELSEHSS